MANESSGFRQASWQIDLGGGNRVAADFDSPGRFWIAFGARMGDISVWMKDVQGFDFRVHLARTHDGVSIAVDRGDVRPSCWTEEDAPRLVLHIDNENHLATVAARGNAVTQQEAVVLAQAPI